MGVEVRHLLEWWCVVCDAINVRPPLLTPQSTRPLESHSYSSIRVNPLCIHLPEWACRSHPMKNAINLINLSGVAKSNYSPTPHTLHNLSALKNASGGYCAWTNNKMVWSSELHSNDDYHVTRSMLLLRESIASAILSFFVYSFCFEERSVYKRHILQRTYWAT